MQRRGKVRVETKSMMVSSLIRSALLVIATTLHSTSIANAQYSTIDGHDCFRDLDGMYQTMFDLAKTYPNLVRVMDIGDSYTKATGSKNDFGVSGYDIYAMNITVADSATPSSEKGRSLITSGIHSREYAPPELSMRFAESLIDGYNNADADITWILQHNEVHFIIHVNPDGRYVAENDRNIYWRKNLNDEGGCSSNEEYGVDINRNFDFMWGDRDGASNDPCDSDYHGDYPESEPETQAVSNYARALFPEGQRRSDPLNDEAGEDITGMYTDIHAAGGYIYFPWGHANKRSPDDEALQALGKKLKYYNNYKFWAPGSPDFLYPASGDASDYMYGALSVASYGLELGEGFYEDCGLFERDVLPKNLPALLYSVSISKRPFHQVKGPDITDLSIASPSLFSDVIAVSVEASDSKKSGGEVTGNQGVNKVHLYLDVHPDDYNTASDVAWELEPTVVNSDTYIFEQELNLKTSIVSPSQRIAAGRHLLYAQAEDGNGYKGPVKATFLEVESRETLAPSMSPVASTSKVSPFAEDESNNSYYSWKLLLLTTVSFFLFFFAAYHYIQSNCQGEPKFIMFSYLCIVYSVFSLLCLSL